MADINRIKSNIQTMLDKGATEQEIDTYISGEGVTVEQLQQSKPSVEPAKKVLGSKTLGNIGMTYNTAGAASRAAIRANPALALGAPYAGLSALVGADSPQKRAAMEALRNPSNVQTFQQQSVQAPVKTLIPMTGTNKLQDLASTYEHYVRGQARDISGAALDIYSNPADAAMYMASQLKSLQQFGSTIAKSKPMQSFMKFLNKKIAFGFSGEKDLLKASQMADDALRSGRKSLSTRFGNELEKIDNINAPQVADYIDEYVQQFPEGVNKTKFAQISKRLKSGNKVSGKELKDLQNEISKTINWKQYKINPDPQLSKRVETWAKIQEELSTLNPQLTKLNAERKAFQSMANDVNSVILERGTPGTEKLMQKMNSKLLGGDKLTIRQKTALKQLNESLPPEQQFMQFLQQYQNLQRAKKLGKGAAILGAGKLGLTSASRFSGGE